MSFSVKKLSSYGWENGENGELYIPLADRNGFCHVYPDGNIETKRIFENKPLLAYALFQDTLKIGNIIVMIPFLSDEIVIYDIESDGLECIQIKWPEELDRYKNVKGRLCGGLSIGNDIFMLGYFCPIIIRLELESREIEFYLLDEKKVGPVNIGKSIVFRYGCILGSRYLYIPVVDAPCMVKMDLVDKGIEYIPFEGLSGGFAGISSHSDALYLNGWNDNRDIVAKYDLETGRMKNYKIPAKAVFAPFYTTKEIGDKLFLLPAFDRKVYFLDEERDRFVDVRKISRLLESCDPQQVSCIGWKVQDGMLYFQTTNDCRWCCYDPGNDRLDFFYYGFNEQDEFYLDYIREWLEDASTLGTIRETDDFSLKELLGVVSIHEEI